MSVGAALVQATESRRCRVPAPLPQRKRFLLARGNILRDPIAQQQLSGAAEDCKIWKSERQTESLDELSDA